MIAKKISSSFLLLVVSTITLLLLFVFNTSTIKSQSADVVHSASSIVDGDLIKTSDNPDIYIVKINNNFRYKRLILNPDIFDSYGHLEWSNVKTVSQSTMNSFVLSQLVREVDESGEIVNGKVYMLFDNGDTGTKRHLQLTLQEFLSAGGSDSAIYSINSTEASDTFYTTGTSITTAQEFRSLLAPPSENTITIKSLPITLTTSGFENNEDDNETNENENEENNSNIIDATEDNTILTINATRTNSNTNSNTNANTATNLASVIFTKGTLQPTTILPGSKKEVLTINVLSSNRPTTVRSMKVALSPTTGTDTSIENTFNQIQLIVNGSVVSTKNIESEEDYEKVLNTAVITLNNLAIDIEEDSTKSIQIHLSTNTTIQESLLKDWNIIINKDSISAIDDDNNTYSNNNPITISTSVRRTNIPTTRPPSTVKNFRVISINPQAVVGIKFGWDKYEHAEATQYELESCVEGELGAAPGKKGKNKETGCHTSVISVLLDEETIEHTQGSLIDGTVYRFRLRAVLPNNRYSGYTTIRQGTALVKPTLSVTNTEATSSSVSVSWTSTINAEGYLIEQCKRSDKDTVCTEYTTAKIIDDDTATSATIADLDPSSIYQMRVKATGNHPKLDSGYSDFSQVYTKFLPPTNLRVTSQGSNSITVGWNTVSTGEGYTVKRCITPISCTELTVADSEANTKQITSLTPNTVYTLSIKTNSSIVGDSGYSSILASRTALAIPENIRKAASTLTSLTLAWDAVAGADGYVLQACEGATCTNFTSIYTGALLTYQYTGLTQSSTYRFRIKSTGTGNKIDSNWSNPTQLTSKLSTPLNFRVTYRTSTTITFEWDAVSSVAGYSIAYCSGSSCTPDETAPATSTTTTRKITALSVNTPYRFKIKAVHSSSALNSDYSSILSTRTTIPTPSNFRKTSESGASVTLAWNSVSGASGYLIDYCSGSSCTPDETNTETSPRRTTTRTIASLNSNTVYKFRIRAQASGSSLPSAYSSVLEARTRLARTNSLKATLRNAEDITLIWNASPGATGYTIQYCSGSTSCEPDTVTLTSTTNVKKVTGLTANTIYRFRVKATGGAGTIDSSNTVINSRTALAVPTSLSSTAQTATSITLSWGAVTGASGYLIEYCSGATCVPDSTNQVTVSGGTTTSKEVTGLTTGTTYKFIIKATASRPVLHSQFTTAFTQATS